MFKTTQNKNGQPARSGLAGRTLALLLSMILACGGAVQVLAQETADPQTTEARNSTEEVAEAAEETTEEVAKDAEETTEEVTEDAEETTEEVSEEDAKELEDVEPAEDEEEIPTVTVDGSTGDIQQELIDALSQFSFLEPFVVEVNAGDTTSLSKEAAEALAHKRGATLNITYELDGETKTLTLAARDALLFQNLDGTIDFETAIELQNADSREEVLELQQAIINGETTDLPAEGIIDVSVPRFMQNTIHNKTGDYTVLGNAEAIMRGELSIDVFPPIRLWMDDDGEIWTLDHRRLAAYKIAGVKEAPFRWATEVELSSEFWKMTTEDNGESMLILLESRDEENSPVVYRDGTVTGLNEEMQASLDAARAEMEKNNLGDIFDNEEINKMVDENYKVIQENGYGELRIPISLHNITDEVLTENSREVGRKLLEAGYSAYVIGGCIRDFIMGKESNDIDIVSDATIDEMRELFGDQLGTHVTNGKEFGFVHFDGQLPRT